MREHPIKKVRRPGPPTEEDLRTVAGMGRYLEHVIGSEQRMKEELASTRASMADHYYAISEECPDKIARAGNQQPRRTNAVS